MLSMQNTQKELFYRKTSDEEATCVYVHGFGCSHEDWSGTLDRLGPQMPSIAVDLPGHGRSYPCNSGTIEEMADSVLKTIRSNTSRPVTLVGHSLGTKIIRECFRQEPKRISALILVDGSTYVGSAEKMIAALQADINRLGFVQYINDLFDKMFIPGVSPGNSPHFKQRTLRLDPVAAQSMLEDSIRWDLTHGDSVLKLVNVPLLLIQSTYFQPGIGRSFMSPGIETPFMKKIRDYVPGAQIEVFEGIGHFPMIDATDKFVFRLSAFLEENKLMDPAYQRSVEK